MMFALSNIYLFVHSCIYTWINKNKHFEIMWLQRLVFICLERALNQLQIEVGKYWKVFYWALFKSLIIELKRIAQVWWKILKKLLKKKINLPCFNYFLVSFQKYCGNSEMEFKSEYMIFLICNIFYSLFELSPSKVFSIYEWKWLFSYFVF